VSELAAVERYVWQRLRGTAPLDRFRAAIAPFDVRAVQALPGEAPPLPVVYMQFLGGVDRNAVGPGRRVLTAATYEIGVFHQGQSLGAQFSDANGNSVALLEMLDAIDRAFQDYAAPAVQTDGYVYSCQRESPVRMAERGPDGAVYRRDGGVFRFVARKP
jgi:hypothetical protein